MASQTTSAPTGVALNDPALFRQACYVDGVWVKARSGFVVEMGDKDEYGSFSQFQDKVLAGKVTADEADGYTRHVAYERGDRKLDMCWHGYTEEYASRTISGREDVWPRFAQ